MIVGIHHTAIATPDIERLASFYCDLFGFKVIADDGWSGSSELDAIVGLNGSAARFMLLDAGNQILELFQYESPRGAPPHASRPVCDAGITHIGLGVRDIDAEYDRLVNAGMSFNARPARAADRPLRAAYGRDPDGNVIELLEMVGDTPFNYTPKPVQWRTTPVDQP